MALRIGVRTLVIPTLVGLAMTASACGNSQPAALPDAGEQTATSTSSTVLDASESGTTESQGAEPSTSGPIASAPNPTADLSVLNSNPEPNAEWTPIVVDQFGYQTTASKVAIVVQPNWGANTSQGLTPAGDLEVIDVSNARVVFSAGPQQWRNGDQDDQAGDRGWRLDFSSVTTPGTYVIEDPASGVRSSSFVISDGVYDQTLRAAFRVFYFNRANIAHEETHAGRWATPAVAMSPGQDTAVLSIDDPSLPPLDLSGGWFDAGDTNKYVTFAVSPFHQLLGAYETAPQLFGDDFGIPESGNGISDLLDEVRVELEWLKKMQQPNGGVLIKMGFAGYDGASQSIFDDDRPRYYEEACSSAAIAAAGMFAHGAIAFKTIDPDFSADLVVRAEQAWQWFESNPKRDDCDPQTINAGDADVSIKDQDNLRFVAATYLWAATGEDGYARAIGDGFDQRALFPGETFGRYHPERAEAVEFYMNAAGADAGVAADMRSMLTTLAGNRGAHGFDDSASLYRSYMPDDQYHWGSNMVMANTGNGSLALARMGIDGEANKERANAHLNYLHGVNPLGLVYLSNMNALGAERSVNEMHHFWFDDDSRYDHPWQSDIGPAPGYVVGGPNANYSGSSPGVRDQPRAKAYLDSNTSSGDTRVWELSEPAIYYQAAYVRLLAGLLASS